MFQLRVDSCPEFVISSLLSVRRLEENGAAAASQQSIQSGCRWGRH